uniref:Ig-like domain-containing protein n=1 Tax=Strigamia maritima TaxID=126957 RepID=T1JH48_STRMM
MKAISYYEAALCALSNKNTNFPIWQSVTWDYSTTLFTMATILQDNAPLSSKSQEDVETEVASLLNRALAQCNLDGSSSTLPLYQYRAATIHHRLASLYHHAVRNQMVENSQKQKQLRLLAEGHYNKSSELFSILEHPTDYLRVQLEQIGMHEYLLHDKQSGPSRTKLLKLILKLVLNTEDVLIPSQITKDSDSTKDEPDEDFLNLLSILEKRLQVVLLSLIKANKGNAQQLNFYKHLYSLSLVKSSAKEDKSIWIHDVFNEIIFTSCACIESRILKFQIRIMNSLIAVLPLFFTFWTISNGDVRFVRIMNGTKVLVRENTDNYLQCKVVGNDYIIQWAKRNDDGNLTTLAHSENLTYLLFHNITEKYEGIYVCQAKGVDDDSWTDSSDSRVVVVPPGHVLDVKILNSTEVDIRFNFNNTLVCKADRNNTEFQWAQNTFFGSNILSEKTNRLTFINMTKDQEGRYVCQAKSKNQSDWSISTEVTVRAISNMTRKVNLRNSSHVAISEHSIHNYLLCKADGYQTQYRWAKVDFWGKIYPIENSSSDCYYLINASTLDEERYACQAKSLGQEKWVTSKFVYVKVIPDKPMVSIVNDSIVYIPVGTKGAFLQCQTRAQVLEYRWVKRVWWTTKAPLPNSNNLQLLLPSITMEVAGSYACQVSVITTLGKMNWLDSSYVEIRAVVHNFYNKQFNLPELISLTPKFLLRLSPPQHIVNAESGDACKQYNSPYIKMLSVISNKYRYSCFTIFIDFSETNIGAVLISHTLTVLSVDAVIKQPALFELRN